MDKSQLFDMETMNLVSVYRAKKAPINEIKVRKRPNCLIEMKTSGISIFTNEKGVDVLSDPKHPIIIPKGCLYTRTCVEPGECLVFEVDCEFVGNDIINFTISDNTFIKKVFTNMELRSLTESKTKALKNRRDLFSLLTYLLDSDNKAYLPKITTKKLQPAIDYIDENYGVSGITNEQLAALCNISVPYFRELFTKKFNRSPISYLNSIRMHKAMEMLKSDYVSISQVANNVGFTNIYHFSKEFKLYTGVSPSEYASSELDE